MSDLSHRKAQPIFPGGHRGDDTPRDVLTGEFPYSVGAGRDDRRGVPPRWTREYNESMNCQVKDELVSRLVALNNKLNLLSPELVRGDEERAEVQQQRENLYAEIKHHRAKGHEGKPCPAARQV